MPGYGSARLAKMASARAGQADAGEEKAEVRRQAREQGRSRSAGQGDLLELRSRR
jgi:hypothetical protein